MTETVVTYHHGEDGIARPAINVKVHQPGVLFWPVLTFDAAMAVHVEQAYERVRSDFWATAEQVAAERGLGEISQEGRSGGWLVFTDGRDPARVETLDTWQVDTAAWVAGGAGAAVREWLVAYRAMSEWADRYIADAPKKVAALAQQWAMDSAGEPAALRMFAFGKAATA